MIEFDIKE